jgi:hypothetical protein
MAYQGKNRYRTHLRAGRIIAGRIAKLDGVVGILGTGSIGRRFADEHSDLDLIVYAHSAHVRRLRRLVSVGWTSYKGMEFDIPVVSYETALKAPVPSNFWSQVVRWDKQNSQTLYDTRSRIERLLKAKLIYPEGEQRRLMARYRLEVQEHLVFFPEVWSARGQLYNVVDALMRSVQSIVLWIYARDRVFEPYTSKWLFYHLETKAVPEHIHLEALTEVYTASIRTTADAMRLRKRLLSVCDSVGLRWDVCSIDEAHRQAIANWDRVSQETKRLLSW